MRRRVLLAGEGANELGGWFVHPSYRRDPEPGVLEALLRKVAPDGWDIRHAVRWKDLLRYRVGHGSPKDELNTKALWLLAREHDCDVVAFSRDRDGVRERGSDIERGRSWLDEKARECGLTVIGGVAVECIEAWVLACSQTSGTEGLSRPRAFELLRSSGVTDTRGMVACIEGADLSRVPADACSLGSWLKQAEALTPGTGA